MKKKLKLFGFIALVAAIIFSMAACGNGGGPEKTPDYNMTGTYTSTSGGNRTWVFTAGKDYQVTGSGLVGAKNGTWSASGNDVTLSYSTSEDGEVSDSEVFTVQANGNQVTLSLTGDSSNLLDSLELTGKSVTLTKTSNEANIDNNKNAIDAFDADLSSRPDNTKDTPYVIKLNIDDPSYFSKLIPVLDKESNKDKYVNIDLSGSTITEIPNYAFSPDGQGCATLTGITIPNSVTIIGHYAFKKCASLTIVTIPNSVTSIGNMAFYQCTSLTSVTIGNSVTNIGVWAFLSCPSLASVTIGNSVTNIGDSAFSGCSITSVAIPNGVTTIGAEAFSGCKLTSITIPNSVKSIGYGAFFKCTSLTAINVGSGNTNYSSDQGILYNKNKTELIMCPEGKTTGAFNIPNSVTTIGAEAFSGCKLTGVTIPNSVTSIGDSAFSGCGLNSVTIPGSITSIGGWAFYCTNLTSVTFQGTIARTNFGEDYDEDGSPFPGDLRTKFYATNSADGTPGTYLRSSTGYKGTWMKQ